MLVTAVSVDPTTVEPLIVTVPLSVALTVLNVAGALAGETECVAVSFIRCLKV